MLLPVPEMYHHLHLLLCRANLRKANLRKANLHKANLRKANLHKANLHRWWGRLGNLH